jgi:hypothetical protein
VGRVWPRHSHRGRPLNSIVRLHVPTRTRVVLFIIAALVASWITLQGSGFSAVAEPAEFDWGTVAFWIVVGIVVSGPLWLAAVIPDRYTRTLRFARWVGAIGIIPIGALAGSIVAHQISVMGTGGEASLGALIQGAVLTIACVLGIVLLVKPYGMASRRAT